MWRSGICQAFLLSLTLAHALPGAGLSREQIEADWERQDERRLAEIREPGLVRFAEGDVQWPGVPRDDRLRVPTGPAPAIDGRLADPCWATAVKVRGRGIGGPGFLLSRHGDWLHVGATLPSKTEAPYRGDPTAADAAGAVDGVKNGRYAFHTAQEPNPWWQVDLGERRAIARIVVWNRLDYKPGLHNADNLVVLTSDDGREWTERYDNRGEHFGGVGSDTPPLTVTLKPPGETRFVRLQVRSKRPVYFHLDEVEIFGAADPKTNLGRKRPARQSSLSQWSRRSQSVSALFSVGPTRVGLTADGEGVTIDGAVMGRDRAAVWRDKGWTFVEARLPASAAPTFTQPTGRAVPLAAQGDWQLAWKPDRLLGFGKNRIRIELHAAKPFDPPVELRVETAVFTAKRLEHRVVHRSTHAEAAFLKPEFEIAHEGAAAVIVSATQGKIGVRDGRAFFIHPLATTLRRAERLLAEFGQAPPEALVRLRGRADRLAAREKAEGTRSLNRKVTCREARWLAREILFQSPLLGFDRLLFVKRFCQETYPDVCLNHMPWTSRPGGDLCVLERPWDTGKVTPLLKGRLGPGHVHGMDLWWDADRVVFGYAKASSTQPPEGWRDRRTNFDLRRNEEPIHLFEIGVDGKGLRQLTDGEWSDLDPTYLPSGEIAFASERCGCSLQCNELDKDETSCNLYIMRGDGSKIRRLSVTKDGDYLPHTLADGTIGYTRWEYQERGWAHVQSLWVVRPDGTGADALFKQHFNNPWAIEDVRSIPGSHKLVAVATGHHTLPAGPVVVLDPRRGMNNPDGIRIVTPGVIPPEGGMSGRPVAEGGVRGIGGFYMHPWPLDEKRFLVSFAYCDGRRSGGASEVDPKGYALYLIDAWGTMELIHRDPAISCFAPIPLRPRPRPPIVGDTTDAEKGYATCAVNDIGFGVPGIAPERIRYLRIAQRLAWPYDNTHGGQRYEPDVKGVMINWTPVRILGDVPIERDGSAHFRVPVDTAVYFQALDADRMELRRMRSFISFQPGEHRGCTGCHETQEAAPPPASPPLAVQRAPSRPIPPPWGTGPVSFLRDVQPVFGRHCVGCHAGLKPAGGLDFSGGLTARHNRCYDTLLAKRLVSRSNVGDDAKVTPPLAFGSHKSKLVAVLGKKPHAERVKLSEEDRLRLVIWIDANAPYHDAFINKRRQPPPYDLAADRKLVAQLTAIHVRRCAACHKPAAVTRLDWIDLRRPARTRFLAAPLAEAAGGLSKCEPIVYNDRDDQDYQAALRLVRSAVEQAMARPRRDVAALAKESRATVGMR